MSVIKRENYLTFDELTGLKSRFSHGRLDEKTLASILSDDIEKKRRIYGNLTGLDLEKPIQDISRDGSVLSYLKAEAVLEFSMADNKLWDKFDDGLITYTELLKTSARKYNEIYTKLCL